MKTFDFKPNDEVFHMKTRVLGVVLSAKDLDHPKGRFIRVQIRPDLPNEIWDVEETGLWIRQKKYLEPERQ